MGTCFIRTVLWATRNHLCSLKTGNIENCFLENLNIYSQQVKMKKMLVSRIKTEVTDISKFVPELGRRIPEEEKRTGSLEFPVDFKKSNVDRGQISKLYCQRVNNKSTFNRMPVVQNMFDGKKTRERVKEKTELTKADGDKHKYMKNGETVGLFNNLWTYNTPNVGIQHSSSDIKKRKDMEINGFSHVVGFGQSRLVI